MRISGLEKKRVFVGLSGGVDSAVTATLLKEAGADVVGVFLKGWYPPGMPCTWSEDRQDAMRVAAHLGIPFVTVDASEEYKAGVIDYLLSEYRAGRTPNPDVMCNREVKFGAFYRYVRQHGGGLIATGHYARIEPGPPARLLRGRDASKDQSYFLWAIQREVLGDILMPLGDFEKVEVRTYARAKQLPVAEKRDSQGICFLGAVSVEDFLIREFGEEPGKAVSEDGKEVGSHNGALLHTIGKRISLESAPPGPWYVLAKDLKTNTLIVGTSRKSSVGRVDTISLRDVNLLAEGTKEEEIEAQYRYHGPLIRGRYASDVFTPSEPLTEEIAQGQSLVLYQSDVCLGGGIIA